ncbi:MAG: bifunctional phosphoribosyl-AMP cyclohydrolase/phosphoribosyl-ATP diphosphatase HisIE [Bacteroidetes bacterium]|nr:bifunctional phosphoribosyl-AMP cyclohydrolase/phosphoribosyl-ATP diphosphatase HisIE [Bacteroidota bacterium]
MQPDFKKQKLIPAIVQDANTNVVLMLGYMNEEAFAKTQKENRVTFFSRSKNRLWTKGETSGNFLNVKKILLDCDNDTILIKTNPVGPACHSGSDTCFNEKNSENFLSKLQQIIKDRKNNPSEKSYTSSLFKEGINKIAQKVGEEATEVIIEAKDNDSEKFKNESADLLFHLLVLLEAKNILLDEVIEVLERRHK